MELRYDLGYAMQSRLLARLVDGEGTKILTAAATVFWTPHWESYLPCCTAALGFQTGSSLCGQIDADFLADSSMSCCHVIWGFSNPRRMKFLFILIDSLDHVAALLNGVIMRFLNQAPHGTHHREAPKRKGCQWTEQVTSVSLRAGSGSFCECCDVTRSAVPDTKMRYTRDLQIPAPVISRLDDR